MNIDQDAKLIAAKACHHIFMAAYRALDMPGQHREQLVAGIMAQAVIDTLEVVDIEEDHRHHALSAGFFRDFLREDLIETTAVEQAGQRVEMGHLLQRGAGLVEFAEQRVDPAQVALLVLQLLVGQGCADAAADHQQGDHRD